MWYKYSSTMANWPPGTLVRFRVGIAAKLRFPPPASPAGVLSILVHPDALKAPASLHTQVVLVDASEIIWTGALDEGLLERLPGSQPSPRPLMGNRILQGASLWHVVRPGALLVPGAVLPGSTIYGGMTPSAQTHRPWVAIGELTNGMLLVIPLNETPAGYQKTHWYSPQLKPSELWADSQKASLAELPHLWSVPPQPRFRALTPAGRALLEPALKRYFY